MEPQKNINLTYVGNYLPRQCGISYFTQHLMTTLAATQTKFNHQINAEVVAVNHGGAYLYPKEVKQVIERSNRNHYISSAAYINRTADLCILQHDHQCFGGNEGDYVLELTNRLEVPLLVILHSVIERPSEAQRNVVRQLAQRSHFLVVMSQTARRFLHESYRIAHHKIRVIAHGSPDLPRSNRSFLREQLGYCGKSIMLTFGLIEPGKGLETMISALPKLAMEYLNVEYWILGRTHPTVLEREGEQYRHTLMELANKLGVRDRVVMIDESLSDVQLFDHLVAADLYISPHTHEAHPNSGTLSYALGAGTPVVSTPTWHAQELLGNGRGAFFDFNDSNHLSEVIVDLFRQQDQLHNMAKRAAEYGDTLKWKAKGYEYMALLLEMMKYRRNSKVRIVRNQPAARETLISTN